ncbi:hypothetical protein BST40_11715 [Mycobacterium persicum]|nr:hypothetical protein BST40_11715 [Mycobacterium persicum]
MYTPEQFWPWDKLTFGQSVAEGVTLLNNAINTTLSNPENSASFSVTRRAPRWPPMKQAL